MGWAAAVERQQMCEEVQIRLIGTYLPELAAGDVVILVQIDTLAICRRTPTTAGFV